MWICGFQNLLYHNLEFCNKQPVRESVSLAHSRHHLKLLGINANFIRTFKHAAFLLVERSGGIPPLTKILTNPLNFVPPQVSLSTESGIPPPHQYFSPFPFSVMFILSSWCFRYELNIEIISIY